MDIDAIAVFVKVVEVGSFSGAARMLRLPKTTASAKVAALEKRLGLKLIQRTTRKLHVTDAGAKYFRHCAHAIREIELGEAALLSVQAQPIGTLRVTAPVDIGHLVLPRITRAYLARYPGTSVELVVTNRTLDLIGEGIDLAVRAGTLKDSSLVATRFFQVSAALWASPAYLKTLGQVSHPKNLTSATFIGFRGIKTVRLTNGRSAVEVAMNGRIVVDDLETIKALAILGEGIAWLPHFLSADALEAGSLLPVLSGWKSETLGDIHFVYPSRKYTSLNVQAFIQVAQDETRARRT